MIGNMSRVTAAFCDGLSLVNDPCLRRTTNDAAIERERAYVVANFAVREVASAALLASGLGRSAKVLSTAPLVEDAETARAAKVLALDLLSTLEDSSVSKHLVSAVRKAAEAAAFAETSDGEPSFEASNSVQDAIFCGADPTLLIARALHVLDACVNAQAPSNGDNNDSVPEP